MTIHLYQPLQPLAADGGALMRILHAAGVEKDDLIRVVGPSGTLAALWLSRHGYDRAVFVRTAAAERTRPADALLVAQPCAAEELAPLLDIAGAVSDDGALIVQTRPGRGGEEFEAVAALLRGQGFHAQRRLNDKGRPICIARRVGFPSAEKAA
ncbi:MAG TPA: hypothetical protein VN814_09770 [Caulobacteraceae bacterium]|nr:hypothetical protein [Caulobacteraceae bacterium]